MDSENSVCNRDFDLTLVKEAIDNFWIIFEMSSIFKAVGAVAQIGSYAKSERQIQLHTSKSQIHKV